MDATERADSFVRTTRAILPVELRVAYVRQALLNTPVAALAAALEVVCARAEQAEDAARETLLALVDALGDPACIGLVERLREEAVGVPLLALERIVRQPRTTVPPREVPTPDKDRTPDYGRGRPLALGERKSLARRPDRAMVDRLLRDPHPDVIRQLLANPKITEDDVLSLATRRPCRPDVLSQISRASRWTLRPRIRMALVLNPDTPFEIAGPLVGLLLRHELRLVAAASPVAPAVRALCREHLERRPPADFADDDTLQ